MNKLRIKADHEQLIETQYSLETKSFGFWIFLAMETMFFGGVFFLYSNERYFYPKAFEYGSHLLDLKLGALNTAVLLTSSLSMALAVHFLKQNMKLKTITCLLMTFFLGSVFLAIKGFEFLQDYRNALLPGFRFFPRVGAPQQEALFQGLYIFAVSLHALHLIIGMTWAFGLTFLLFRVDEVKNWRARGETLGLYWHFVDVIWIFLFPLFYLVGGPK
jgi:cytochrome c oxidase subunit 3